MINIRSGLFETNSSSVHSLVMCTKNEYDRWLRGEMKLDTYKNVLVTTYPTDDDDRYMTHDDYDDMLEESYYEHFYDELNGVIAFGYYGHDN